MIRKFSKILGILILIVVVFGIILYGFRHSSEAQNYMISSDWEMSKEVRGLNSEIDTFLSENNNDTRIDLLNNIDNFVKKSVTGKTFSIKPYLLIKLRLDNAKDKISKLNVPEGKVKLWYLYNMGVVIKSSDVAIAFDLPNTSIYTNSADFTKYINILIITHLHADHFDSYVVRQALKNGVTVIVPKDSDIYKYNFDSNNLITIRDSETVSVKGVKITGYSAIHSSNINIPVDWFLVEMKDKRILHTGDGIELESGRTFYNQKIDVFLAHFDDDRNAEKMSGLVPNVSLVLPLHILELGHGSEIVNYMMYKNTLEQYVNGYWKHNSNAKFLPLIWGEGLEI